LKIYSRILVVLLMLLVSIATIGAVENQDLFHIIAYYSIEVEGKSNEKLLKDMIAPPGGDPPYATVEAMVQALEAKRNRLNNMRIFEEVSYTYEAIHADNTAIRYRVKFFIDDAFSFIAIPYPKYDSNYGFRLGLKAYDKNLFGSFADLYFVVNTTQIDSSWEDYDWFSEISVSNIPVGKSSIDIEGEFEAVQHGSTLHDVFWTAKIDWTGIPLAQTTFDFHVDVDENTDTTDEFDKMLTTSAQWNGLPWFNSLLNVRPSMHFKQAEGETEWDVDSASFFSSVNPIRINGETYVFTNTMKLKFPHDYVQQTSRLSLVDAAVLGMPVSFWISADNYFDMDDQAFYNNTYTVGTSLGFKLPLNIGYSGSYEASFRDAFTTRLNHIPVVSMTQTVSFGNVNWKNNFRRGLKGSVIGKADYAFFSREFDRFDYLKYSVEGELEAYLNLGKRFGLSTRGMGFYSHVPSFDWYDDQTFPTFLPSSETSASEKLRGILDDTYEEAVGEGDYQKLGAVLNMDATLMFIKFKGFAEGFMSAFMDVGIFTDTRSTDDSVDWNDITLFKTIGIEGYGIMDKFPSYPIRGSLGFNLDDVVSHFKGDIGFTDIEFELTIGMGLHY